jgi:hypothetical protein
MVTRRKFLGMLAVLPAITALAGSGLRLPPRKDVEFDATPYLTSKDAWFIKTEDEAGLKHFNRYSNRLSTSAELNEKAIEDILRQLKEHMREEPYRVLPTKLIVPPRLAHTAHYVLTHKPTLFERFMWRLFPVD